MITAINIGQILSFYPSDGGGLRAYHEGYGILASKTKLIPWGIKVSTGSVSWVLRGLSGTSDVAMSSGLLNMFTDGEGSQYVFYNGSTVDIPCGMYEVIVTEGTNRYTSEVINVVNTSCGYESAALSTINPDASANPTPNERVYKADITTGSILSSSFQVSVDGAAFTDVSGSYYEIPGPGVGEPIVYKFRRSIKTSCGTHTATYTYDGGLKLTSSLVDPVSVLWELKIAADKNHNDILYAQGYEQKLYFYGQLTSASPEEITAEQIDNGQGEQYITYAEVLDAITITAVDIPDAALSGLFEGKHRTATIKRAGESNGLTTEGYQLSVSPDDPFNNVALTFKRGSLVTRQCPPELTLTAI